MILVTCDEKEDDQKLYASGGKHYNTDDKHYTSTEGEKGNIHTYI